MFTCEYFYQILTGASKPEEIRAHRLRQVERFSLYRKNPKKIPRGSCVVGRGILKPSCQLGGEMNRRFQYSRPDPTLPCPLQILTWLTFDLDQHIPRGNFQNGESSPPWRLTMFKALYRAYLRFLLNRYTRELQVLAAQRANDALAEQVLTREAEQVRARLLML
jgi:hypothetical protein